jgi:transketolase
MKVHGGTRPYGGTFLTFSDYMRGAVRLSALMRVPVTYVWTHDSIGLGEDGPTHQPIEHVSSLRLIPGLDVVRPSDANETAASWAAILHNSDRPAALILSRQNLPIVPRGVDGYATTENVAKGAYVLKDFGSADADKTVIIVATGSEVPLAVAAAEMLAGEGVATRVVSMPCREWFDEQDDAYRESVIPAAIKARVSVEAGVSGSWRDIVGDAGRIVSINHYGASADGALLFKEFGFTPETVAAAARESLAHVDDTGAPLHAAAAGPKNTGDHTPDAGATIS